MSIAVELPALGESIVEGTIARWLVKEGESVQRDQPLVEVTTDTPFERCLGAYLRKRKRLY